MDELYKLHVKDASIYERAYLMHEPTGVTAKTLVQIMADHGLSVAEMVGCLEFAKFITPFQTQIPTGK